MTATLANATVTNVTHIGRWAKNSRGDWMVAITDYSPARHTVAEGDTIIVVKRDGTRQDKIANGAFEIENAGARYLYGVRNSVTVPAVTNDELAEGVYVGPDGEYVMVTTSDAGNLYGKVWNADADRFEYVRGSLRLARNGHPITADEAAAFGHTTHRCVFCARNLSTAESTAVGYGPICADNYGLPWGVVSTPKSPESLGEAAEFDAEAEAEAEAAWRRENGFTFEFDQREEHGWNRAL